VVGSATVVLTTQSPYPPAGRSRASRDSSKYIARLPKREHSLPEWQYANHALMLVAEEGGPTVFPRIAMLGVTNGEER
jgi:hypothetical protein